MPTIIVAVDGCLRVFADEPPLPAVAAGEGAGFMGDDMRYNLKSRQRPDEAAA